jgi:ABC-type multidrug transport system ATPase subunit
MQMQPKLSPVSPVEGATSALTTLHVANDVLVLRGIRKRWKRNPQPVLEGVDLDLAPGTSTWVGGRNGVGKTTLLRIAGGLIGPDAGSVSLEGLDPEAQRTQFVRRVGLLSAGDRGIYARFSPRQHLAWVARLTFIPFERRGELVERAIELFELGELTGRRADRLSLGQRQRLRLAITFLHEPRVVLLDEPLNSLDDEGVDVLLSAVNGLKARGGAVMWCSPPSDQRVIDFDRRYLLQDGLLRDA